MASRWDEITDGLVLIRELSVGRTVVRVGVSRDGEIVLEFDSGCKFAIGGGIGVDLPVEGAAVVGDLREWVR